MSEYIGSRISLISKSDIKYVGTLHEINSDTHTVALESVTSYGTEGRKGDPAQEIPGSDQVYEYIVFRGSDVKELKIIAPPTAPKESLPPQVPDDPAILGSARPISQAPAPAQQSRPQSGQPPQQFRGPEPQFPNPPPFGYPAPQNRFQNESRFQGPGGAHGFPGMPGAVPNYGYPPPPPGYGNMGYGPPPGHGYGQPPPPPGAFAPPHQSPHSHSASQANQLRQPQGPASGKENLPQTAAQHPPPIETQNKPVEMAADAASVAASARSGPPPPLDSKPVAATMAAQSAASGLRSNAGPKPASKPAANRVAVPLPAGAIAAKSATKPSSAHTPIPATNNAQPWQSTESAADATQAATAAVAAAMAKLGNNTSTTPAGNVDKLADQVNAMRIPDSHHRGRERGFRGASRGGRRDISQQKIEVPKEDYDFESANAKFNRQELVRERIAGSPVHLASTGAGSDAAPTIPAVVTGNGHIADGEDVAIPPSGSNEKGYDKKSSFFDNISSDLRDRHERQETIDGRAMRREERSRNVETFGQGSIDGAHRGAHRGRGGRGRGYSRSSFPSRGRGRGGSIVSG